MYYTSNNVYKIIEVQVAVILDVELSATLTTEITILSKSNTTLASISRCILDVDIAALLVCHIKHLK